MSQEFQKVFTDIPWHITHTDTNAKVTPNARLLRQEELLTCGLLNRIRLELCGLSEISDTLSCCYALSLALCWNLGSFSSFSFGGVSSPKIETTTAVFTMSELMWAINTLSLALWSWFVSELGALVLIDCRIANLYDALFLYTDFSPKTLCTLWGECPLPQSRGRISL